jgi:hypothetical protein
MPAQFTVTAGTVEVTKQLSEATLKFETSTATVKTLLEETEIATGEKCTLTLAGYQDWTDAETDSICWLLWNNALQTMAFEVEGTSQAGDVVTATGNFQARRPNFGPTADDAAKFSLDIPVIGMPTLALVAAGAPLSTDED